MPISQKAYFIKLLAKTRRPEGRTLAKIGNPPRGVWRASRSAFVMEGRRVVCLRGVFKHQGLQPRELARVELDDQVRVDLDRDVLGARGDEQLALESLDIDLQVFGNRAVAPLDGFDEHGNGAAFVANADGLPRPDDEGRDVDLLAVNEEVAMADELAGGKDAWGEAHAIDHVVETPLEHLQEVVAGDAGELLGAGEGVAELALEQAVGHAKFLLFKQVAGVVGHFPATATTAAGAFHAGCVGFLLGGTLGVIP